MAGTAMSAAETEPPCGIPGPRNNEPRATDCLGRTCPRVRLLDTARREMSGGIAPVNRRLVFALLAMGVAQAAVYVARPMTSYRLLGLGAGAREVGLVAASFALVPLFLAVPLGRFSDRRGGARLLVVGCAIQVVACVLLAAAETTLGLAAASALLGLGHLGLALGVQDVIARESGDHRHDQHFGLLA